MTFVWVMMGTFSHVLQTRSSRWHTKVMKNNLSFIKLSFEKTWDKWLTEINVLRYLWRNYCILFWNNPQSESKQQQQSDSTLISLYRDNEMQLASTQKCKEQYAEIVHRSKWRVDFNFEQKQNTLVPFEKSKKNIPACEPNVMSFG